MPSVAVVFASDSSGELERLAFRTPVWLVDTPENRTAAEEAWRAAIEWPHITVTLFRAPEGEPSRDDWRTLVEQIEFQEKALDGLEVIGSPLTIAARAALTSAGFTRFDETAAGFRARRL